MHDFLKKKTNCCILYFAEVCFKERCGKILYIKYDTVIEFRSSAVCI